METFTHHLGSDARLIFQPQFKDGTIPDLANAQMELIVNIRGRCVILTGERNENGFAVDLSSLPPDKFVYYSDVRYNWGRGWEPGGELKLHIKGGC